ncbi:hypothetical protein Pcinc_007031, partial [Petrolisthes cinctipes]
MEIHQAVADFSEDLVLAYLRERSEAVGIPTTFSVSDGDGDGRDTCSSDDDRLEANHREYEPDRKTMVEVERSAYWNETERKTLERSKYWDETERKTLERSKYWDETERKPLERYTHRDVEAVERKSQLERRGVYGDEMEEKKKNSSSLERNAHNRNDMERKPQQQQQQQQQQQENKYYDRESRDVRCTTSVRAKQRATSIDSGVCVDAKRENVNNQPHVRENEEREPRPQRMTNERCFNSRTVLSSGAVESTDEQASCLENTCGNSLVLAFRKGDVFAVLDRDSAIWLGVLALRSARVGYVPSNYLKFVEERHLWLTKEGQE